MLQITVKKGTILQTEGLLNTKIYQVKSGLLRSYIIDSKGKEHTFMFAPEGWVMADVTAPDQVSRLFIDALEDSVLMVKEKKPITGTTNVMPFLKRISVLQERTLMLMSSSGIERYEHFINTYPEISQRVSQRMIASYLGITPEALSKLKGERLKNKWV